MGLLLLRRRIRLNSKVAALALLTMGAAGCSSDFTRFDPSLSSSAAVPAASQDVAAANPYPADVDSVTTASISPRSPADPTNPYVRSIKPGEDVSPRLSEAEHDALGDAPEKKTAWNFWPFNRKQNVSSASAGVIDETAVARQNAYTAPGEVTSQQLSLQQPDPVVTASVQPAPNERRSQAAPANGQYGWNGEGGTAVTVRDGETVFNMAKRYGVPADAIFKANNLKSGEQLQVGQQVIIPAYVYSSKAAVSAPDNNVSTANASSVRGGLYEPDKNDIPLPQKRPNVSYAAVEGSPKPVEKAQLQDVGAINRSPDKSIVTGSLNAGATYTVKPGDSLIRIASLNKVSVAELSSANGLSGNNIRVGQALVIPGTGAPAEEKRVEIARADDAAASPKPYVKPKAIDESEQIAANEVSAPARTGIEEFRWPVTGKVVVRFGERAGSEISDGVDISVPEGTAVKAAENGVVVYAGNELERFGNLVLIRHAGGWVSAYAHNKSIETPLGTTVRRGEIIARSGRTGDADQPKLHFELRRNSTPVDPLKHLSGA